MCVCVSNFHCFITHANCHSEHHCSLADDAHAWQTYRYYRCSLLQPSALFRVGGDGSPLRLPGPGGRPGIRGRLGVHPRVATRGGLGGYPLWETGTGNVPGDMVRKIIILKYSETGCKDHLYMKAICSKRPHFTGPQVHTFHAVEPAYKDHLCIKTRFCWCLGWSLYTTFPYWNFIGFPLLVNTVTCNILQWQKHEKWNLRVYRLHLKHVIRLHHICQMFTSVCSL